MKLKRRISKLDDVAEQFRPLYVQDGEGFKLAVDIEADAGSQGQQQNQQQQQQTQQQTAAGAAQAAQGGDAVAAYQRQLETLGQQLSALQNQVRTQTLDKVVLQQLSTRGLQVGAEDFALSVVKGLFTVDASGNIVQAGKTPVFSKKDPTKQLTVEEYISDVLPVERSFLFKNNTGSGAQNQQQQQSWTGPNPFDKKSPNYTKQAEVIAANPGLAKSLAEQAGVSL